MTELKVGSKVWVFDNNHRVYPPRQPGQAYSHGGPIYREYWVPTEIVGETARSWIIRRYDQKVNKKTLQGICVSQEELDRLCWIEENRHQIVRAVERCDDYDTLQKIAELARCTKGE